MSDGDGTPKTSATIFEGLLAEAGNDRRRETLGRLREACDDLAARGQPLRLADIQKAVESRHGKEAGPKAQSVSNERKRPVGMYHYVEARERERAAESAPGRSGRCRSGDPLTAMIDSIDDMDVRSAVRDLQDRCIASEKALERAKVLFKALRPGMDIGRLFGGEAVPLEGGPPAPAAAEQVEALGRLIGILTDDAKLGLVGLGYDGRRVRRRSGTRDELVDPNTLDHCAALLGHLGGAATPKAGRIAPP
jgi:hypothetical protein